MDVTAVGVSKLSPVIFQSRCSLEAISCMPRWLVYIVSSVYLVVGRLFHSFAVCLGPLHDHAIHPGICSIHADGMMLLDGMCSPSMYMFLRQDLSCNLADGGGHVMVKPM